MAMSIQYDLAECWLGLALVAATQKGIAVVRFGDDRDALVEGLKVSFQDADITPGDAAFAARLEAVLEAIERPAGKLDLALDVKGTIFEQKVWAALRAIPAGQTRTYGDIARAIGSPKAHRAVGRACGANPVAVLTPCHRVVGQTGSLTGYRWGVERKAALLDRELLT